MSRSKTAALLVLLGFCLLHVVGVISYLLRAGRLSMAPIYDDVAYLVDGLNRLAVLDQHGVWRFLLDFYTHPPHAPLVALTSALGLMLSAGQAWGPYVLSAGWITVVLVLAWCALRPIDPWARAGILVALLACPQFILVLAEFRPDTVWGLLVGFAAITGAKVDAKLTTRRKLLVLGLLFGVAIIYKPTGMPGALAVLGVAWVVQAGARMLQSSERSLGHVAKASGWVALGAACIVVPYVLTNGAAILAYVREVMGTGSMWKTPGSTWDHMTHYLNRASGTWALGWIYYAALPVLAGCAARTVWLKDKEAFPIFAGALAAMVAAYVVVTVSSVKTLMIGSILYGTIIATVVWGLGYLMTHFPSSGRAVLAIGAMVFATQWVPGVGQIHKNDPNIRAADKANRAILPALLNVLRENPGAKVLVTVPGPTYAGTLDFLTKQEGVSRTFIPGYYTLDTWERMRQKASEVDVIVLSETGMAGQSLGWTFPSLQFQTRLLEELRAGSEFTGSRAFTDEKNRSVWLFVRR